MELQDMANRADEAGGADVPPNASDFAARARDFENEIERVIIGQTRAIKLLTIAIIARGHVLLEGDVGVGKTTLLRAAARGLGGAYERVEGTIDLMPTDLVYHTYLDDEGRPRVEPGPVLRHGSDLSIFFFNEINRARPQVHSLMLRLMAERSVTGFNREFRLPHMLVFADRNKIEREETFELPAAARDRFFMEIGISAPRDETISKSLAFDPRYHDTDALISQVPESILDHLQLPEVALQIQENVKASNAIQAYVVKLWNAARDPQSAGIELEGVDVSRLVQGGPSPRGMSYLIRAARVVAWLDGRSAILPEDVREVFNEVMAHRIFFQPVYELRRETIAPALCTSLFEIVPVP